MTSNNIESTESIVIVKISSETDKLVDLLQNYFMVR